MRNSTFGIGFIVGLCTLFHTSVTYADGAYLPKLVVPISGNDNQLHVSGTLNSGSSNSRPCTYQDRPHPIYGKVDGLTTVSLPVIEGECFDVSILLPEGVEYVTHTVSLGSDPSSSTIARVCPSIDPILGGATCIPRTRYENGNIEWRSGSTLAGNECSAIYNDCDNTRLFELLYPRTSCVDIGEKYRTVYAYFTLPPSDEQLNYKIFVNVQSCSSGGVLEGN